MNQSHEFYAERAAEAKAEAGKATLDNVRDRALRAEATWQMLADQAHAVKRRRERLESEKAAARAAEVQVTAAGIPSAE